MARRRVRKVNNKLNKRLQIALFSIIILITLFSIIFAIHINNQKNKQISKLEEEITNSTEFFREEEVIDNLNMLDNEIIKENEEVKIKKESKKINISAIGNIITQTPILEDAKSGNTYNFNHMLKNIKEITKNADITIGHLETSFANANYSGSLIYNAPKELGYALKDIGIDMLSLANNHSLDMGYNGLLETMTFLDEIGIGYVGVNKSLEEYEQLRVKTINDIKLGFISYTYGLNPSDKVPDGKEYVINIINKEKIKNEIELLKSSGVEYIIAFMHWGDVASGEITTEQEELATFLFNNNVDLILGSHPETLQRMQVIEKKETNKNLFVAYSVGNFLATMSNENSNKELIINLEITKDGETGNVKLTKVNYVQCYMVDRGKASDERFEILDIEKTIKEYENGNKKVSNNEYQKILNASKEIESLIGK